MGGQSLKEVVDEAKSRKEICIEIGDLFELPIYKVKNLLNKHAKKFEIRRKASIVQCVCGYYGEPRINDIHEPQSSFVCPKCGSTPIIIEGDQIRIID